MAKIIPLDEPKQNPLEDLQRLANLKGYGDGVLDTLKEAFLPYKIKIEGNLIPDWLITLQPTGESKTVKFIKEIVKPKVYILTRSGYAFGIDTRTGKVFKVKDYSVFQAGTLQQLLSNPVTLVLLGLGLGAGTYLLFRKLREG